MKQVSFTVPASREDLERVLATLSRDLVAPTEATTVPNLPDSLAAVLKPLKGHDIQVSFAPPPLTWAHIGPLVFRFQAIARDRKARRITSPVDLGKAIGFALLDLGTGSTVVTAEWEESTPFAPLVQLLVDAVRNVYSVGEDGQTGKSSRKQMGPPRLEDRDPEELKEKRDDLQKYLDLRAQRVSQEVAADRVGHSRRTMQTWLKHPEIGGKLAGRNG